MLVSEGGKAMQSGENVLSAIRHDGTGNYAANLARQGWDALGKGMHNTVVGIQHSLKNSGRAWNRFVSGWQDAKQAANAAHSNPNNTVMRDFWDGQFKRFGDWSKGHGWSIGNTIMNARTGYTDFRGIHDMKNIAAVDARRTVWDTMNFGQHVVSYANATYDTLAYGESGEAFCESDCGWWSAVEAFATGLFQDARSGSRSVMEFQDHISGTGKVVRWGG